MNQIVVGYSVIARQATPALQWQSCFTLPLLNHSIVVRFTLACLGGCVYLSFG
jgi:hypothetical protein